MKKYNIIRFSSNGTYEFMDDAFDADSADRLLNWNQKLDKNGKFGILVRIVDV